MDNESGWERLKWIVIFGNIFYVPFTKCSFLFQSFWILELPHTFKYPSLPAKKEAIKCNFLDLCHPTYLHCLSFCPRSSQDLLCGSHSIFLPLKTRQNKQDTINTTSTCRPDHGWVSQENWHIWVAMAISTLSMILRNTSFPTYYLLNYLVES